MNNLVGLVSSDTIIWSSRPPSPYGEISSVNFENTDNPLLSYAQSLTWQGKAADPTGLIWIGARHYDPISGRFLSPDPLGHPNCLDLYAYANGDPINFNDPDGRCACQAFQTVGAFVIDTYHSNVFQGTIRVVGGFIEASVGATATMGSIGIGVPIGFAIIAHGLDQFGTGLSTVFGYQRDSATSQLLQKTGMSVQNANLIDDGLSIVGTIGGAGIIHAGRSMKPIVLANKEITAIVKNSIRDQVISDLKSAGLSLQGKSPDGRFMTFVDKSGNIRAKIHPADRITQYDHLHLYDQSGNSLDKYFKVVKSNSVDAHIPLGDK